MALLKSESGELVELHADHLVGRSSRAHTQLVDPAVSGQHASVRWTGREWQVRDLGSRNGTWIDGRRLASDAEAPLAVGTVVWFGGAAHAFTVVDLGPPRPVATSDAGVLLGDPWLFALPSEDDPRAVLSFDVSEGWQLSVDEVGRAVSDGDTVEVDGVTYTLTLPSPVERTVDATQRAAGEPSLHFAVSADEEYVELTVQVGAKRHRLAPRAHQYTLLVLARARLDDANREVPASEQGWTYTASLAQQLKVTMNRLYVALHRCRKELDAVHEGAGDGIIEKRVTTRQVRFGWSSVEVGSL